MRSHHRHLRDYAVSLGAEHVEVRHVRGHHPTLFAEVDGTPVQVRICGSRPSDQAARQNTERKIRHAIERARGKPWPRRHERHTHHAGV